MKIWTITSETQFGTFVEVVFSEGDATARAADICEGIWDGWGEGKMPPDWRDAMVIMSAKLGFMDTLLVTEHDISGHPLIAELIAEVIRFRATHEFYARQDDQSGDAEGARLKRLSAAMLDDLLARVGAAPDRKEVA
jgi:hypothetical protein